VIAAVLGVHELLVLAAAGAIAAGATGGTKGPVRTTTREKAPGAGGDKGPMGGAAALLLVGSAPATAPTLWGLFLTFAKIGSVLFGSGYVLLAFLRADLVERFGWITEQQLLDAVVVGQVTPGPVFTTATFIGFLVSGPPGALVATLGIFLPAFVFVAISGPLVPRIRRSPVAGAVLDGVIVASLALMAVVTWQLARSALVDWATIALALCALVLLLRYRIPSAWLILGGAIIGSVLLLARRHPA
jgi:chromate transporter